jgi:hypothetical protein
MLPRELQIADILLCSSSEKLILIVDNIEKLFIKIFFPP